MTRGAGEGGRRGWADRAARRAGREPADRGGPRRLPRRLAVGGLRAGRGRRPAAHRGPGRGRDAAPADRFPLRGGGVRRCSSASGWSAPGLLPLLAFTATGRIFALAAAGDDVPGLTDRQVRSLSGETCFGLSQADYLGGYPVVDAFELDEPLRLGLALGAARAVPAVRRAAGGRARPGWHCAAGRAGRAGSSGCRCWRWSCSPRTSRAGSSGHLWVGITGGWVRRHGRCMLLIGAPSRETMRRSLEPRDAG